MQITITVEIPDNHVTGYNRFFHIDHVLQTLTTAVNKTLEAFYGKSNSAEYKMASVSGMIVLEMLQKIEGKVLYRNPSNDLYIVADHVITRSDNARTWGYEIVGVNRDRRPRMFDTILQWGYEDAADLFNRITK